MTYVCRISSYRAEFLVQRRYDLNFSHSFIMSEVEYLFISLRATSVFFPVTAQFLSSDHFSIWWLMVFTLIYRSFVFFF